MEEPRANVLNFAYGEPHAFHIGWVHGLDGTKASGAMDDLPEVDGAYLITGRIALATSSLPLDHVRNYNIIPATLPWPRSSRGRSRFIGGSSRGGVESCGGTSY